jgi:hypothetical protein
MQGSFALLMWKNAKLHQRRPKGTFVQIMLPVAFVGILWLVRNLTAPNKEVMCERYVRQHTHTDSCTITAIDITTARLQTPPLILFFLLLLMLLFVCAPCV